MDAMVTVAGRESSFFICLYSTYRSTFSADSMGAMVGIPCIHFLSGQDWCHGGYSVYLLSAVSTSARGVFCVPTLADSQGMGAMVDVLCTYLSRQPRYGRYAGCSVYLS